MSLIRCPECEAEISDKAQVCPKCGTTLSIKKEKSRNSSKKKRKNGVIVAIFIFLIITIGLYFLIKEYPDVTSNKHSSTQIGVYINKKFGYSMKYPKNILYPQGESDNGDGQFFLSKDGESKLRVWGEWAAPNDTLDDRYYSELKNTNNRTIVYKAKKSNWFVISGYIGDKIYYQRTMSDKDAFATFIFEYKTSQRKIYDKIAGVMSWSFKFEQKH